MRESSETLELRKRNGPQVQRAFGTLGEADDHQSEAVFAGIAVLLDEATLLQR